MINVSTPQARPYKTPVSELQTASLSVVPPASRLRLRRRSRIKMSNHSRMSAFEPKDIIETVNAKKTAVACVTEMTLAVWL